MTLRSALQICNEHDSLSIKLSFELLSIWFLLNTEKRARQILQIFEIAPIINVYNRFTFSKVRTFDFMYHHYHNEKTPQISRSHAQEIPQKRVRQEPSNYDSHGI